MNDTSFCHTVLSIDKNFPKKAPPPTSPSQGSYNLDIHHSSPRRHVRTPLILSSSMILPSCEHYPIRHLLTSLRSAQLTTSMLCLLVQFTT